jgi:hypothetical protein
MGDRDFIDGGTAVLCVMPDVAQKQALFSIRFVEADCWVPTYLVYQHGMLLFALGLLGGQIRLLLNRPPPDCIAFGARTPLESRTVRLRSSARMISRRIAGKTRN